MNNDNENRDQLTNQPDEVSKPEVPAPEAVAPEATVPETAASEAVPPETPAPEAVAPEATVSETAAPEAVPPETPAPEAVTPETDAPEAAPPEAPATEAAAPETATPEATAQETPAPAPAAEQPAPKKSGNKALIGIAAAVVVVLVFVFARGPIRKMFAPEQYFDQAIESTMEKIERTPSLLPYYEDISKGPFAAELSFEMTGAPYLPEYSASVALLADPNVGKILTELSLDMSPDIVIDSMGMYLSSEIFGLYAPQIYSSHDYITINPATVEEDYQNWFGSSGEALPPEVASMIESYTAALQAMETGEDLTADTNNPQVIAAQELTAEFERLSAELEQTRTFAKLGKGSYTTLAGENASADQYTVTYSQESVQLFLDGFMDAAIAYAKEAATDEYQRQTFDDIPHIEVAEPVALTYSLNSGGQLVRLETSHITLKSVDEYGYESSIVFSVILDLASGDNPLDNFSMRILAAQPDTEEVVTVDVGCKTTRGAAVSRLINYDITVDGESARITIDFNWDQAGDGKMTLVLGMNMPYSSQEEKVTLSGTLTANKDEVRLADMKVTYAGYTPPALINASIRTIDPSEVEPDLSDSISLFDLTPEELLQITENMESLFS